MAQPYVGEIRMVGFNFAPAGWMTCDGQLLPIAENTTLFQLLGTTYGGDGQSTFALPDLRGRLPMHIGQGVNLSTRTIAESFGAETVTLTTNQIPNHKHPVWASAAEPTANRPDEGVPARGGAYAPAASPGVATAALQPAGGSQPHDNMQPYVAVNFIISLFGIFPSQT
jgi:microcystin-dependent protein